MEHIACYLKDIYFNQKKGKLIFRYGDIAKYLFFQDGFLIHAKTNQKEELIGKILFKLGKISGNVYADIDRYIEPEKYIGQVLLEDNLISKENLDSGLSYQMKEIVMNIFPFFDGEFKFQEKKGSMEAVFVSKISIPVLIENGIRQMKYNPALQRFLAGKKPFCKNRNFLNQLTEEEKTILTHIDGNALSETVLSSLKSQPEFFWKSLYLLYCLDLIDMTVEKEALKEERKFEGSESKNLKLEIANIEDLSRKISDMNYYQILDVPQDAKPDDIKKAYFNLARKYHPDIYDRNLPSNIKVKISDIFEVLIKAYNTLSDGQNREKYDAILTKNTHGKGEDRSKRAEIRFRQAKTLYNQTRYEDAMILLEEAVRLVKNKSSYFLLLALSQSKISSLTLKAEHNFKKAIELESWNAEPYVGLGMFYKKEGLKVKASKQFEKALAIDPDHKIALREMNMTGKSSKKKGLKELLSLDIFGRKKK